MTRPIFWLDLETTGLDPHHDTILEVGIVASRGLEEITDHLSVVIKHDHDLVMPVSVLRMHLESDLMGDIQRRGVPESKAAGQVLAFLERNGWTVGTPLTMGGSGIDRFDRPFMRESAWLCGIDALFGFRTLDVSALKELMRVADVPIPEQLGTAHRAVHDAEWSFEVARQAAGALRMAHELTVGAG